MAGRSPLMKTELAWSVFVIRLFLPGSFGAHRDLSASFSFVLSLVGLISQLRSASFLGFSWHLFVDSKQLLSFVWDNLIIKLAPALQLNPCR
jgi:hypothetical protein